MTVAPKPPTPASLRSALGRSFASFRALSRLARSFRSEWRPSKAGGWLKKVHDGKKALCWVAPLDGAFRVSLTIRGAEREALLADAAAAASHAVLRSAKRYPEGYLLRYEVRDGATLEPVARLLERVIALRGRAGTTPTPRPPPPSPAASRAARGGGSTGRGA